MGLNVGGAYLTSQVTGQDSEAAMIGAGFGTMLSYLGSGITSKMEAAEIKNHFGMSASKTAFEYSDKSKYSNFITEGTSFSPILGIVGGGLGSFSLEYSNSIINSNTLDNKKVTEENKQVNNGEKNESFNTFFIFLILLCAIVFSISAISVEWLLTDRPILELDWKKGFETGGIIDGGAV